MLILDYWGRQINPSLYSEKFVGENDESTFHSKQYY
jgi:hypothetical protein